MASEDAKPRLYSEAELMSDKAVEAAAKAMFESRVKQAQERIGLRKFDTDELFSFYSGLTFESDRAVAILSFTYTETVLERLFSEEIDCHFIGGDSAIISPGGVLDTVTKRLKIAAALGWISEHTYKNITRLARIRNRFAHRVG